MDPRGAVKDRVDQVDRDRRGCNAHYNLGESTGYQNRAALFGRKRGLPLLGIRGKVGKTGSRIMV